MIEVTGSRPGEKIVEELVIAESQLQATQWEKILLDAPDSIDSNCLREELEELRAKVETGDRGDILTHLRRLVPTYSPVEGRPR